MPQTHVTLPQVSFRMRKNKRALLCLLFLSFDFAASHTARAQTPGNDPLLLPDPEAYRDPLDTRDAAGKPIPVGSDGTAAEKGDPVSPERSPHPQGTRHPQDRLLWGGELRFDVLLEDSFSSGEAGADLLLRARTPEREGFFVQAEAALAHDDEGVKTKELFLGRRYGFAEARAGLQKKQLGRHQQLDDTDRLSLSKPVVYDALEEFDFAAREIRVGFVDASRLGDAALAPGFDSHVSFGSGSATNFNILAFAGELSPQAPLQYGGWALLQAQRYRSRREPVWSAAAFLGSESEKGAWAVEAIAGKDPFETDWERTFNRDDTQVVFWSTSVEGGFTALSSGGVAGQHGWRLTPFLLGSYFVPRQSKSKQNTLQGVGGLRWQQG
ncbi:MAG: hypothetical protein IOD12_05390, partial [Silvanigrellales bacterium]|nr:hypothetical protein [Silvanigrellales bacterium]